MKPYTLTYRRRGNHLLLHAKVFSDTLTGAEKALVEFEDGDGHIIDIIDGMEADR